MGRIVIEVADETAKKWRSASAESKERVSQMMNIRLIKTLMRDEKEELKKVMDRIGRTAQENGLTEEILQEILAEDD